MNCHCLFNFQITSSTKWSSIGRHRQGMKTKLLGLAKWKLCWFALGQSNAMSDAGTCCDSDLFSVCLSQCICRAVCLGLPNPSCMPGPLEAAVGCCFHIGFINIYECITTGVFVKIQQYPLDMYWMDLFGSGLPSLLCSNIVVCCRFFWWWMGFWLIDQSLGADWSCNWSCVKHTESSNALFLCLCAMFPP